MKFSQKTGMLLLILAIPVLIYLFLQGFGSNEYSIPIFYEEGISSSLENCEFSDGQHYIPDFNLVNQDSASVDDRILEDNITVVDFFFTSCPDICPVMISELSRVEEIFQGREKVKILSFTVDPAHDTPKVLKEYGITNEVSFEKWQFLTGMKDEIYGLARCGFLLPVQEGDGGEGDFIHSEKVILVDKSKRIRGYYDGTSREEVDRLITEINILLEEVEKE